jgi:hypothetical protein
MVTAKHNIIRIQLISGMYICPCTLAEVCTIFTRGKQPREVHCLIIENVPVITAWLPTTAARMAIARTGHLIISEIDRVSNIRKTGQGEQYNIILASDGRSEEHDLPGTDT